MVKYILPSFEILTPIDRVSALKTIERAGRTCYKSEDLITEESASNFVKMIVGRGHMSVIEHVIVTVKFIVPRGFSHEMVRHRMASYSQESTRFCDYGKQKFGREITVIDQRPIICAKFGIEMIEGNETEPTTDTFIRFDGDAIMINASLDDDDSIVPRCERRIVAWMAHMNECEKAYLEATEDGLPPEIARGNLPIDLKTEIVMTANLREWLHVFSQRASPAAHPNMRQIMIPLREKFREILPEIFGEVGSP